jgi:hypothetical protein
MEDQRPQTLEHIETVKKQIDKIIIELQNRAVNHDQSKLKSPEKEIFDEYTPKLRDTTYGSDEYKNYLKEMKPALDHHYKHNRHHPEHFFHYECNGCFKVFKSMPDHCDVCHYSQFTKRTDISQMNLIDLIEMICDWKAATLRHADGDIRKSININQKRFEISDQLTKILHNTVDVFEE